MSTAHVRPSPELRAEVNRVLEHMVLVRQVEHLLDGARYPEAMRLLQGFTPAQLIKDAELGVPFAWGIFHTQVWERKRLLRFVRQVRSVCERHPNPELLHRIRNLEGVLIYHLGDFSSAEQIWREEALACVSDGYERGEMFAWSNLGMVTYPQGRFDEAFSFFQRAIPLARRVGLPFALVTTYNNIGMTYLAAGRPKEAEQAVMVALQESAVLGWDSGRCLLLISLGQTLVAQGEYRAAHAIATRARQMEVSAVAQAELNRLLGAIYLREGDLNEAEAHLQVGLQEARSLGERLLVAEILEYRGELLVARGEFEDARNSYLASEAVYLELPSTWHAMRVRSILETLGK